MVHNERKAISSLAVVMAFRMLGMFMILPIFSLYATKLEYATPFLIGLALGVYGLTQACLQIPLGSLSDKIGRKKVISFGLIVFALGSMLAALSHSIYGVIAGRALQGAGAVGSTILALAADLTRDENRSKAMATIGLAIGTSFMLAMIAGPALNQWFQLSGIFWSTMGLALIALLLINVVVPTPPKLISNPATEYQSKQFSSVLKNTQLLRLNLGIFSMHAILTATFIAIPILLTHMIKLSQFEQVMLYLIVLVLAFILMVPFIIIGEKKRKLKPIFLCSIIALIITELTLANNHHSLILLSVVLLIFFTAFTLLEASLPSMVSKLAPIERKGTAMGIYSTSQFLGIFIGGSLGGLIFSHYSVSGLFSFCAIIGIIWFAFAVTMAQPPYLSTFIFQANESVLKQFKALQKHLTSMKGVSEVAAMPSEGLIYIKADRKIIDKEQLRNVIDRGNLQSES